MFWLHMYKFLLKPCSPKPVFAHGRTMATFCLPPTSFHPTPMMSCSPPELTYHNWGQSVFLVLFIKMHQLDPLNVARTNIFPMQRNCHEGGGEGRVRQSHEMSATCFDLDQEYQKLLNTHTVVIVVTAMSCSSIYCTTNQKITA